MELTNTLIFLVFFGVICLYIAQQKNRSMLGWFILGFCFSFIALIAILGVPSKERLVQTQTDEKHNEWECPQCHRLNPIQYNFCPACQHPQKV